MSQRQSPANRAADPATTTDGEGRCCYRNESLIWQPRCVVWLLIGFSLLLLYAGLSEGQIIGPDMGAGPISETFFWFCIASSALCFVAMQCYCRVTPVTVHLSGDQLSIALLRPFGKRCIVFSRADLKGVSELAMSSDYGHTPTMYRLLMRSRWLPILLDERADILHLAPIKSLLR